MHVVRLLAGARERAEGIRARWQAGLDDARRMIERAPWRAPVDPMEGVVLHELSARTGGEPAS